MGKMIRFYRDVLGFEIKVADPEGNLIEIGSRNKPFEEKDAGR